MPRLCSAVAYDYLIEQFCSDGSADGKIRQGRLQKDLYDAADGRQAHRRASSTAPASRTSMRIVLTRDQPATGKGKVLIESMRITGSSSATGGNPRNLTLHVTRRSNTSPARSTPICKRGDSAAPRVVPDLPSIEQNDWNLNISHYVDTSEELERIDVAELLFVR